MANKKEIKKKNWMSSFTLIGEAKVSDFTFKIDEKSEKSKWVYNQMNLGVDCGEKHGVVYTEMMGGFSEENQNKIYAHGKDENGKDDFDNRIEVSWEDRFDDSVLETIGDMCFITVGLEKTDKDKTFYKKFLTAYDAIAYIKEHLTEGTVVNVKGTIKYSEYNGNVNAKKNVTSIVLSQKEKSDYTAKFIQSILVDKDSASLKNVDKDKGVMFVDAKVLDYVKEYNGVEVKGQFPFNKTFEFPMNLANQDICKKIVEKLFKVKKGYTQITFEGEFIEGGAVVQTTMDDIPDEVKELIAMGLYTEEDALARCSANGNKEYRMLITKPFIKMVGEETKTPVIQKFEEAYDEDDLYLEYVFANNSNSDTDSVADTNSDNGDESSDLDWLESL